MSINRIYDEVIVELRDELNKAKEEMDSINDSITKWKIRKESFKNIEGKEDFHKECDDKIKELGYKMKALENKMEILNKRITNLDSDGNREVIINKVSEEL